MKTLSLISVALLVCYSSALGQEGRSPEDRGLAPGTSVTYFAAVQPYSVTIETSNGVVLELYVPKGVFLSVQAPEKENPDAQVLELPRTFRGDVTLRMRRADEVSATESTLARETMAKSPVELTIAAGTVVVAVKPSERSTLDRGD